MVDFEGEWLVPQLSGVGTFHETLTSLYFHSPLATTEEEQSNHDSLNRECVEKFKNEEDFRNDTKM